MMVVLPPTNDGRSHYPKSATAVFHRQQFVRNANICPAYDRRKVALLHERKYNLQHVAAVTRLMEAVQGLYNHLPEVASFGLISGHVSSDALREEAKQFKLQLEALDGLLKRWRLLKKTGGLTRIASKELHQAFSNVNEDFGKRIGRISADRPRSRKGFYLQSERRIRNLSMGRRKGFSIIDSEEMVGLVRTTRFLKNMGHGFIGLALGLGAYKTYEVYEKTHDWDATFKEFDIEFGGIMAGVAAADLTMVLLAGAPVLLVIISATAVSFGAEKGISRMIKKELESI